MKPEGQETRIYDSMNIPKINILLIYLHFIVNI